MVDFELREDQLSIKKMVKARSMSYRYCPFQGLVRNAEQCDNLAFCSGERVYIDGKGCG
jgi:hypothetical protein